MVSLTALWLPILLSAVAVFVASSIIHMVFTYHRADVRGLPKEAEVMDALRPFNIPPGDYTMPRAADAKEMGSPEFVGKLSQGPVAFMTVYRNGPFNMGKQLTMWFVYCLVVGLFAGYLASRTLAPGTDYLKVFRVVGTVAFAGYGLALVQDAIWWGRNWGSTMRSLFDSLVYALLTAGMFGWRWP
ncbi:MAG TPA: hypothetical protein VGA37_14490 [Gemmatimonadales bacterium]